jgi:SAM-dependent methyltransferase
MHSAPPILDSALPPAWEALLPRLLPDDQIVPTAALSVNDPEWERRRAWTYPARLGLTALAQAAELQGALSAAGIERGMRVLDASCGPGVISRLLGELGADVVGIDVSTDMLEVAQALPPPAQGRLMFYQASLADRLPFDDRTFDAVLVSDVPFAAAMPELRRVLVPGGLIIARRSGLPCLTFAWDTLLDTRLRWAYLEGIQLAHDPRWRTANGDSLLSTLRISQP